MIEHVSEGSPPNMPCQPFKKAKTISSIRMPQNVSFKDHIALLGDGGDAGHQTKKIRQEMASFLTCDGPCGQIMRSMEVMVGDKPYKYPFLHPCALLQHLCKVRPGLGDIIRESEKLKIALYMDECKPGNVLRPDASRSLCCWYWTLIDLPPWFQTRENGWWFFGAFPSKLLPKVRGGNAFLFSRMVSIFFDEPMPFDFKSGFPCHSTAGAFLCQAVLGAVLSDEKSLKELWSLRGAAGTKPCCLCQNVVGHMSREDVASHEWLVHYSCTNRTRFAKHTSASFQAMRDRLALVAAAGSKKELNALGQCFGLQYNDLGVLWHPTLKDQVCPVSQTMYDWMHVLVASGGVAQYEVNEFAKAVQQLGIPLSTLDQFSRTVILPWGRKNIPRDFFQERINPENDSHVRAFATEVMVALPILALFIETVLEPNSLLPEHCTSLKLMAEIIDILTKMDGAVHLATQLRDAVDKHGILFDKLYPGCVKPKAHWKFHIPEQIQSFGVNMSCFSPERKHRAIKAIASHVFNDAISGSVCLRIGYDTIQHFAENDNCCRAMHLEGPVREVEDGAKMLNFWSNEVSSVSLAKKIKTPVGVVAKGDLVLALDERMALRPHVFLEAVLITGHRVFLSQVVAHKWATDCLFEPTPTECLVEWRPTYRPVMYTERSCGSIHACLSKVDQDCLT